MGRVADLALIDEFLVRAAAEGGSLVLAGEPGIGKTALLRVAAGNDGSAALFEAALGLPGLRSGPSTRLGSGSPTASSSAAPTRRPRRRHS